MTKKIFYGKQFIDKEDILSVNKSLTNNLLSGGKIISKFENKLKFFFNSKYTLACSSGTAGLHLAMISINLKKNDIVLMPAINFIASYNIAKMLGARIYLVDVDNYTGQMTPELLNRCIKENKIKKIKAIINMYNGGNAKNIKYFFNIKKKYNCVLIEDACHALGSKYKIKNKTFNIGSCKHSDLAVFSFHPVKSITTGEGGMVSTNNKKIFKKLKLIRSHGIERKNNYYWKYNIRNVGLNYRLSDINCALGISQLKKIKKFINKRRNLALNYISLLSKFKDFMRCPEKKDIINSSCHLFIISINFKKLKSTKDKFINFMNKHNIYPQFHYIPIFKFDVHKNLQVKSFKNSLIYYKNCISLPIYYDLSLKDQKFIISNIKKFINYEKQKN